MPNRQWLEVDKGLAEENLMNYNNPARVDSLLEQMFIQVIRIVFLIMLLIRI
jgi:hypothetical protein